ncbi:MAG: PilN domain-containing protein [Desulfotignum sp.]|nr:PilN domain-containing protein [Desulfotignum sp.]
MSGRHLLLDINAHGIGATTLERRASKTRQKDNTFLSYETLPDPREDTSLFRTALTAIADRIDLDACSEAVVFISSQEVCFRNISLPFASPGKISQVLPFELSPYLPGDSYMSDFLLQDLRFVQDQHLLLTASLPLATVEDIAGSLQTYKIRPRVITPKGYALAVSYMKTCKTKTDHIFIHLDLTCITCTMFAASKPVMVRTLASSDKITDTVGETIFRMITGFRHRSGRDTLFDILMTTETGSPDPDQVTQSLRQMMEMHAFFHTDTITPVDMDTESMSEILFKKPGAVLNFSKTPYGPGAFFNKFKAELLATAVMAVMVFTLFIFSLYQNIFILEKQISLLRTEGAALYNKSFPQEEILPGHSPLLLMQARVKQILQQKGGTLGSRDMNNTPDMLAIDVLYELSARIPADMNAQLSRLLFNHGQVTIAGSTDSFNTVDRLKSVLEKSAIFKTVTINTADADKTGSQVIFQFNIHM